MPAPATTVVSQRPDLVGSMEEFPIEAAMMGSIALQAAPVIDVSLQADTIGVIRIEEYLQEQETKRASGSGYKRDDFNFEDISYSCVEHGLEGVIDDRDRRRYKHLVDAELVQAKRKRLQVMLAAENRVSALLFNATTFSGQTTAMGTAITNYASSTPVDKVETAVQAVYDRTGLWPNTLIMNRKNFRNLRHNAQVISRVSSSGAGDQARQGDITVNQLSQVFDLPNILVGGMATNSANRGQTASLASAWSDSYMMVCYLDQGSDHQAPSLARTFHWSEDGSQIGGTIETYREEQNRSDIVRVRHDVHEKVIYPELGQLITGVI